MRQKLVRSGLVAAIAYSAAVAQDTQAPAPIAVPAAPNVSSIKIVIEDKALYDGELRLNFTPEGGETKAIRVSVAKSMNNKEVTNDLVKELTVALGADYEVERYDPNKIRVSARQEDATFHLTLAALTAGGLSVRLK